MRRKKEKEEKRAAKRCLQKQRGGSPPPVPTTTPRRTRVSSCICLQIHPGSCSTFSGMLQTPTNIAPPSTARRARTTSRARKRRIPGQPQPRLRTRGNRAGEGHALAHGRACRPGAQFLLHTRHASNGTDGLQRLALGRPKTPWKERVQGKQGRADGRPPRTRCCDLPRLRLAKARPTSVARFGKHSMSPKPPDPKNRCSRLF